MRYRSATMPEPKLTTAIKREDREHEKHGPDRAGPDACLLLSLASDGSIGAKTWTGTWQPGRSTPRLTTDPSSSNGDA